MVQRSLLPGDCNEISLNFLTLPNFSSSVETPINVFIIMFTFNKNYEVIDIINDNGFNWRVRKKLPAFFFFKQTL